MNTWDAVGFLAAGLVIAAFCMKDILHLRMVAVASNVAFLTYGVALGLMPVWLLHLVLLPVNVVRLWQVSNHTATTATQHRRNARLVVRRTRSRRWIRENRSSA
jgi:hypothetical protein